MIIRKNNWRNQQEESSSISPVILISMVTTSLCTLTVSLSTLSMSLSLGSRYPRYHSTRHQITYEEKMAIDTQRSAILQMVRSESSIPLNVRKQIADCILNKRILDDLRACGIIAN